MIGRRRPRDRGRPVEQPDGPVPPVGAARRVVVYTRDGCGLCREAERLVAAEADGHEVVLVDIDADDGLQRTYNVRVPVVEIDGVVVAEGLVAPGTVSGVLAAS